MSNVYHFECKVCEYTDKEAGRLAREQDIYCPLCLEDCGHFNRLRRWLAPVQEVSSQV